MNKLPILETERLLLRSFEESDAPALYNYAKSAKVGPMAGWKPHESVEESAKIVKMFLNLYAVWAIIFKETNELIGSIGLHESEREGIDYDLELGYAMSEDYWGRGIMPEAAKEVIRYAFEKLKINTLFCAHFFDNCQSKRVIEKCGFQYYTKLEKTWKNFDGKELDEICYLLKK